jgi:hypothetical protein
MSGVWLASRRQRCLAFLAGPLFDLTTAAGLALLLFATRHGLLQVDQAVIALVRASLFIALARLLWQTYFFVPTDLYYVIGTLFGCKNLMQDTQTFVLNGLARVLTWLPARDQSAIPTRELRVVRWFAIVWLGGRAIAFASLFWITLPILTGYGAMLVRSLAGDAAAARRLEEGSVMPLVAVALQAVGLLIWSGSLVRRRLRSRRVIG